MLHEALLGGGIFVFTLHCKKKEHNGESVRRPFLETPWRPLLPTYTQISSR